MKCKIPNHSPTKIHSTTLAQLTENKKINRFEKGEIVFVTDKNQYMMYDGEQWVKIQEEMKVQGMSNIELTAYDLNKQIISQMPILEDWTESEKVLNTFITKSIHNDYLLLCKDISYYTIFQKSSDIFAHFSSFGEAVLTCASDIGDIIAVDYMDTTNTVEIWVRKKESKENLCMVLFECHDFIVTYGE